MGIPYTAECPYQIGLLSQYYSITWTIAFNDKNLLINTSTTDYQLIGSSLRIATFTPLIQALRCVLTVTGVPPFQGPHVVTRTAILSNIRVQQGI